MGDKVYVCLKMSKKTLEVEATHQFKKLQIPYSLAMDKTHLYAGMYSYPGKIAKISKQTMGLDKLLALEKGEDDIRWLVVDPKCTDEGVGCLFAFCNTVPGRVVQIALDDFNRVDAVALETGENHLLSGCVWDSYLYVATNTAPATIVKVDKRTMLRQGSLVLDRGQFRLLFQ